MRSTVHIPWLLASLLAVPALGAQPAPAPGALSVESLYHPARRIDYVEPLQSTWTWRPDGTLVEEPLQRDRSRGLARLAPPAWEPKALLTRAQFGAALAGAGLDERAADRAWPSALTWNAARDAFLVAVDQDLYLVEPARPGARRITASPGAKEAPCFSPDGSQVAYLKGNDLYAADIASGKEIRLTTGGDQDHLNGRLDWLYQEELFPGQGPAAFWWSPDSRQIAFLSLDESQVPRFTLLDERSQPVEPLTYPFPQAGDPNPVPHLGVAGLDGSVTWMEDPYPDEEVLVVQVGWDPKGRLLASYQDRPQTWLECMRFEGGTGASLVREESRGGPVERLPLPVFLPDGGFLWQSARTGYRHIYRYDAQGKLKAALTAGPWDVRALHGVEAGTGKVFFSGTRRNPIGLDAYSADLDAAEPNQGLSRLTDRPGTHLVQFNPAFTMMTDRWSDLETPPQQLIANTEGRIMAQLASRTSPAFKALPRARSSFQQVPTRDGAALETLLVLPPGFDPARRYPVVQVLSGAPRVRNAFDPDRLWYQFLAQQGIVTWICDNRGGPGGNLGPGAQELQDQLDGLAWLKNQRWADLDRIALCGQGYGGFLAAYALTHSKAWKLGILAGPVLDWRLCDSIAAERLLGLPEDNADGYLAASPVKAADSLAGRILLIQGSLDQEVHPQQAVQFLDALQKAGLGAPLILLPGSGHTPRAPQHVWAMRQAIWEFLQKNL